MIDHHMARKTCRIRLKSLKRKMFRRLFYTQNQRRGGAITAYYKFYRSPSKVTTNQNNKTGGNVSRVVQKRLT